MVKTTGTEFHKNPAEDSDGVFTGTVYGPDGQPVEGAIVWAARLKISLPCSPETTTNREGRFSLRVALGDWYVYARKGSLGISADAPELICHAQPGRPTPEITLRLSEQGMLEGRVLAEETGEPLANAWVWMQEGIMLRTDRDGKYTVGGLPLCLRSLIAYSPGRLRERVFTDNSLCSHAVLDIRLPLAGTVAGKVEDPDGRPIPQALVARGTSGHVIELNGLTVPCDGEGRFQWDGVPFNHPVSFRALAEGYQEACINNIVVADSLHPAEVVMKLSPRQPVKVKSHPIQHTIQKYLMKFLGPKHSVRGIVMDEHNNPLPGVLVLHPRFPGYVDCSPTPKRDPETRTDANGCFRFEGLSAGRDIFDFFYKGKSELRGQKLIMDGSNPRENTIIMLAKGAIRGRVVDPDGRPVKNFRIRLDFPYNRDPARNAGTIDAAMYGSGLFYTSEQGEFVVSELVVGHMRRVVAIAKGYMQASAEPVEARPITQLPPVENLVLQLKPVKAVQVEILDKTTSKPVANAQVAFLDLPPHMDGQSGFSWGYHDRYWNDVRGITGPDGIAGFPALHFEEATVIVQAEGFVWTRCGWRDGSTQFSIPLEPEAGIEGIVRNKKGVPLDKADVHFRTSQQGMFQVKITEKDKGRFSVRGLPAGRCELWIYPDQGQEWSPDREPIFKKEFALKPGVIETIEAKGKG